MKIEDLNDAISEAERFLRRAKTAKARYAKDKMTSYFYTCKEAAAAQLALLV